MCRAIRLAPDVEAGIRRRIEDGGFKDENEVMREAQYLLDQREYQREQFRISVQEDFAAVKRGEGVELTPELWEELIREADDDIQRGIFPDPDVYPGG